MMKEHDMAIVTSGLYSRPLPLQLLAISANPVKVFTIQVLHEVEQVAVFIAPSRNIAEFLFGIAEDLALELEVSSVATR